MKRIRLNILTISVMALISVVLWQELRRAPVPHFKTLAAHHDIQIRAYPALDTLTFTSEKNRQQALDEARTLLHAQFAHTHTIKSFFAPTLPVMQEHLNDNIWLSQFILPKSLPAFESPDLKPNTIPPKKMLVIQFSGYTSNSNLIAHLERLQSFAEEAHLKTTGHPIIVFYNGDWTLPFIRRNEIMLTLAS